MSEIPTTRIAKSGRLMISRDGQPERPANLGERLMLGEVPTLAMAGEIDVAREDRPAVIERLIPVAATPERIRKLAWERPIWRQAIDDAAIAEVVERLRATGHEETWTDDWTFERALSRAMHEVFGALTRDAARRQERRAAARLQGDRLTGLMDRLASQADRSWRPVEYGWRPVGEDDVEWGHASPQAAIEAAPAPGCTSAPWIDLFVRERSTISDRERERMIGSLEMGRGGVLRSTGQALGLEAYAV